MENKDLKEIVSFIVCLAEGGFESAADGRLTIGDARHFMQAFRKAGPAFEDFGTGLDQLVALGPAGCKNLIAEAKEEFDIKDDSLEEKIEGALDGLCTAYEFYLFFRKFLG